MPHSRISFDYHFIWSTKDRWPWLKDIEFAERVFDYLAGGFRGEKGVPYVINGGDEHVHVLASLRQDCMVSRVIGSIKSNCSGWIHREFPKCRDFEWQQGYAGFTVSRSKREAVRNYIEGQREHDRRVSYLDEMKEFLRRHNIEFDEDEV